MNMRRIGWVLWALVLVAGTALVAERLAKPGSTPAQAAIGGPFHLVDHHGNRVSDQDYAGKYLLLFFGYSYCPDVCPTVLSDMTRAFKLLDEQGVNLSRLQPLFVTVDPERDSPAVMARYVGLFDPRLVGLTGSVAEIAAMKQTYRIYAAKSGDGDDYLMDHSAVTYLMGPDHRYLSHFDPSVTPEAMAAALKAQIKR